MHDLAVFLWQSFFSSEGQAFLQNIIAALALVLAVGGVRDWNKERRDLRRAELAEKALAVAYRARDAISMVRSPAGHSDEGTSRQSESEETPSETQALNTAFTQIERLNGLRSMFEELQTLRYSISAAFGLKAAEPLLAFLNARFEIIMAAQAKMRDIRRGRVYDGERTEKRDAIIWEGWADKDPIKPLLNKAVADLEQAFRPYVEATFHRRPFRPFKQHQTNTDRQ